MVVKGAVRSRSTRRHAYLAVLYFVRKCEFVQNFPLRPIHQSHLNGSWSDRSRGPAEKTNNSASFPLPLPPSLCPISALSDGTDGQRPSANHGVPRDAARRVYRKPQEQATGANRCNVSGLPSSMTGRAAPLIWGVMAGWCLCSQTTARRQGDFADRNKLFLC